MSPSSRSYLFHANTCWSSHVDLWPFCDMRILPNIRFAKGGHSAQTTYGVPSCHFGKCRQRPFNHLIGCRQTDSEVARGIHDATWEDEDVAIGECVPLPPRIAIGPFAPKVEGTFGHKN